MKKANKFSYVWRLWVNYGQGWEHETDELTYQNYKVNRKAYKENCSYPQRWTNARVLN